MLEITKKNCYKCDLETIIDNNSQYFWINLRDSEAETESKWLNIFNKHDNKSTLKYKRELTPPNIKFQTARIFLKNDLFEQVIKSCKATNTEFLCLKKNYVFMKKITMKKKSKIQDEETFEEIVKLSTKKLTKELIYESDNESTEEMFGEIDKESEEEFIEDLK